MDRQAGIEHGHPHRPRSRSHAFNGRTSERQRSLEACRPRQASRERISHVEPLEFPEVTVVRVQRPNTVLEQDHRADMGVTNQVPTNRHLVTCLYASKKAVQFRYGAHVRQPTSAETLPSASSGVGGAEKMRGCVAMRRYGISVGQVRQSISGPAAQDSTKRRART